MVFVTNQSPVTEISFSSLNLPEPLARGIADAGFERCTPIQAGTLPRHHDDPFDRLLIAQAMTERLTLVTADDAVRRYDVPVL